MALGTGNQNETREKPKRNWSETELGRVCSKYQLTKQDAERVFVNSKGEVISQQGWRKMVAGQMKPHEGQVETNVRNLAEEIFRKDERLREKADEIKSELRAALLEMRSIEKPPNKLEKTKAPKSSEKAPQQTQEEPKPCPVDSIPSTSKPSTAEAESSGEPEPFADLRAELKSLHREFAQTIGSGNEQKLRDFRDRTEGFTSSAHLNFQMVHFRIESHNHNLRDQLKSYENGTIDKLDLRAREKESKKSLDLLRSQKMILNDIVFESHWKINEPLREFIDQIDQDLSDLAPPIQLKIYEWSKISREDLPTKPAQGGVAIPIPLFDGESVAAQLERRLLDAQRLHWNQALTRNAIEERAIECESLRKSWSFFVHSNTLDERENHKRILSADFSESTKLTLLQRSEISRQRDKAEQEKEEVERRFRLADSVAQRLDRCLFLLQCLWEDVLSRKEQEVLLG